MKALISNDGDVVEVSDTTFAVHPSWVWVDCPAGIAVGDRLVDGQFLPPTITRTPKPVPTVVTMRQARLALLAAGLLDNVDAAIAAIPDATQRRAAQIEWEYAQTVDRGSPFTQQLAAGLGLSAEQLDALFIEADAL